jgi:hypothetical protein
MWKLSLFCRNYRFSKNVLYIINRKIHGCLEIPDLFLVLKIISHSFAALTREISCSTLEINLVFPCTHVLFSIYSQIFCFINMKLPLYIWESLLYIFENLCFIYLEVALYIWKLLYIFGSCFIYLEFALYIWKLLYIFGICFIYVEFTL